MALRARKGVGAGVTAPATPADRAATDAIRAVRGWCDKGISNRRRDMFDLGSRGARK
jgi:hypothetical protein